MFAKNITCVIKNVGSTACTLLSFPFLERLLSLIFIVFESVFISN